MKRRALLKCLAVLSAPLTAALPRRRAAADAASGVSPAFLAAMVDAIVPRDSAAGAVDLGIDRSLAALVDADTRLGALYARVFDALGASAGVAGAGDFASLPRDQRTALLETLLDVDTPPGRSGRMVYHHARRFVMQRYYASAIGQASVGYRPPAAGYPSAGDERSG